ncbi:MAG: OmpA family protein, partial [Oleiphilaceae bacterium]|nr:OmpA family protein [Oleiphilaceae bacterium]
RGTISERALEEIDEACEQLHRDFGHDLAHFNGDRDAFLATEDTLRRCLLSERLEPEPDKPRKPWLALALLSAIAIGLIWQASNTYTLAKERRQVLATIAVEQGYILLDHSYQNGVLLIEALRDHRAADESELLAKLTSPLFHVSLNTHEVTLGAITPPPPPILPEPPAPPTLQQQYIKLRQALNDSYFQFDEGAINLQADELPKLARTLESINRLLKLANELKLPRPQILLMGLADPSGSAAANIRISQQRAEALRDLLAQNGIDNNVLIAWGLGEQKAISADAALQRRVSLRVIDTMDGARPLP